MCNEYKLHLSCWEVALLKNSISYITEEWDKFYPKKVIQIGGEKLSTQISKKIYAEELSKKIFFFLVSYKR